MDKYSSLIRKLVDATAEAEYHGEDVADMLKERCFNDMDVIRKTLMNAVCDPRFKLKADIVGYWRDEARNALTQLAEQLEKTDSLDEESAYSMLDDFLNAWLRMTFQGYDKDRALHAILNQPFASEEKKDVKDALEYLKEVEELEHLDMKNRSTDTEKDEDAPVQVAGSTNEDPDKSEKVPSKFKNREIEGKGMKPMNSINMQLIEETFLELIPMSLIRLARLIGRMGDNGNHKKGKFLTASKSDIAGITTGNNLRDVLPSELSMLAEHKTQDVFYHNFTSRRLQLFASASSSQAPRKRHDGPVIICVDASSSMAGEPIQTARALAIAVSIIAWRRDRDVIMVKYSDTYDYMNLGHDRSKLSELSEWLTHVPNAGNNENSMFRWLFKSMKPQFKEYEAADILCISDFGWTSLTTETKDIIEEQKSDGLFFYGLNVKSGNPFASSNSKSRKREMDYIVNGMSSSNDFDELNIPPEPMDICDSVWTYEKGECIEVKKATRK